MASDNFSKSYTEDLLQNLVIILINMIPVVKFHNDCPVLSVFFKAFFQNFS